METFIDILVVLQGFCLLGKDQLPNVFNIVSTSHTDLFISSDSDKINFPPCQPYRIFNFPRLYSYHKSL